MSIRLLIGRISIQNLMRNMLRALGTVTDRTHLNSESDAKYAKSFRQLTREALPRLDNYRNIMSLQAANRPTLDELHNATLPNKKDATVVYISNIT
ncbi:Amino acid permease N-terminal [Popillia japonica]|uniref:Amino acid permease N-terminal n=1 Tax=Popillia japonica TaxID=7064 RepID=A0AAW1N3M7_POPJA